jgi:glucosamine--fructose-6-phosphate aminotransferase (isomerizing)
MANSYLSDLLDQPRALRATLEALAKASPLEEIRGKLQEGKYRRVILTGMGSSFHGLYPLQLLLFSLPVGVTRLETAELIHYAAGLIDPGNLIIAVSQSGESAEIVQLLERTRGRVDVVGVTNTAGSALAERSSRAIITQAGEEATVSCKTYISALAALVWLGDELLGDRQFESLVETPERVAAYWMDWRVSVEMLRQELEGVRNLYLLGRGGSLPAALAGALIIKEASRFGAEGMNCAAFRHGPLEVVTEQTLAFVFDGEAVTSEMNRRLVEDISRAGGRAVLVGKAGGDAPYGFPRGAEAARPMMEIMLAQMVSLALAEIAGQEAGRFRHARKVTIVE